ncbi:MAG: proteasome subunit alpha [Brooklawnia sp.]|uniref:proteasome subunit alpha n=1 Tax=Brooklawnia sp. TaxID=2699740 RepID=UPI003C77045C
MSLPFYVAPEQQMKDRADFALKGIARGRSVMALRYRDGVVIVAENPSGTLHKISEIYDRIGFAAVGRYNEFESLRIAGIRYADLRGYSYDRRDVTARGLVNAYSQQLGAAFSSAVDKPYEVELIVAEVGQTAADDQIFRLGFDGTITDEPRFAVVGGATEALQTRLSAGFDPDADLTQALTLASRCFSHDAVLERAVLDRTHPQPRKFRRVEA